MVTKIDIAPTVTVFRLVRDTRRYTSNYMNKLKIANIISAVKEKHKHECVCL